MKKSILALTLIASTISGAALARDGFYVGAAYSNVGYGSVDLDGSSLKDQKEENGYSVFVGYDFPIGSTFVLGTEFEYKDLGGVSGSMEIDGDVYKTELNIKSIGLNVMPKVYFGEKFNLFAKAGLHKFTTDATASFNTGSTVISASLSEDEFSMVWGLGLGYDLTQNIALNTTYEVVGTDSGNIASANIGLKYKF
ncbi:outer membrane protein [Vibrio atypicus]|uniref:outer membrane protein n=1 Tax=Vibrio atypicus TaxID=558271 RepID=UPI00135C16FD|nr:outer membrane beta-barrel protein [Vibrio atypicus]